MTLSECRCGHAFKEHDLMGCGFPACDCEGFQAEAEPPLPQGMCFGARTSHPDTSKESARKVLNNLERLGAMQNYALNLVRLSPGAMASELAEQFPSKDSRAIPRRLSELRRAGRIYREGRKWNSETERWCSRWWPSPKEAA